MKFFNDNNGKNCLFIKFVTMLFLCERVMERVLYTETSEGEEANRGMWLFKLKLNFLLVFFNCCYYCFFAGFNYIFLSLSVDDGKVTYGGKLGRELGVRWTTQLFRNSVLICLSCSLFDGK
jgi:hypothetical protein